MELLSYEPKYRENCLDIFQSNIPDYFLQIEKKDFEEWLERNDCPDYQVLKFKDKIIGCGGFYLENGNARFVFGIIHKDFHGLGLGTYLTASRIQKIHTQNPGATISLETTENTWQFFSRFGFETASIVAGHYHNTFDKYEMVLMAEKIPY